MEEYLLYGDEVPNGIDEKKSFTQVLIEKMLSFPKEKICAIDAVSGDFITFSDCLRGAVEIAQRLKSLDITTGDIVVLREENNIYYHQKFIGCLLADVVVYPMNPAYTLYELSHLFSIVHPKVVITSKEVDKNTKMLKLEHNFEILCVPDIFSNCHNDEYYENYLKNSLSNNIEDLTQPIIIVSSSGTSGLPKGVLHSHNSYKAFLHFLKVMNCKEEDVTMGLLPFFHTMGLFAMLGNLYWGQKMIIFEKFKPNIFLSAIAKYHINKIIIVPTVALFLAQTELLENYNLSSLKEIICAGAALSDCVYHNIIERLKVDIRIGYGMSEMGFTVIMPENTRDKIGSSGRPLSGCAVKIVDISTKKSLPAFKSGEIRVKSPSNFLKYYNNEEETRSTIDAEGFICSGDIAYYDEEGYIYIIDRQKELIKCKGYQVSPAELESVLLTHHIVKDAAVVGIPDARCGELAKAFIVLKEHSKDANVIVDQYKKDENGLIVEQLLKHVASHVSPYKQLGGGISIVKSIPKNAAGKILRRKLKELYNDN